MLNRKIPPPSFIVPWRITLNYLPTSSLSLNFLNNKICVAQHIFFSVVYFLFFFSLRDIVLKLLQYEASTNVADNKGYFPIHLAAWKGDVEIVKILIHHGPSHSRVNEQVTGQMFAHTAVSQSPKPHETIETLAPLNFLKENLKNSLASGDDVQALN